MSPPRGGVPLEVARAVALALPEAVEEPHFEYTSWRVRRKIFATVPPEGDRLHVFVAEPEVHTAVAADPDTCQELWWGKRLSGVRVDLKHATEPLVRELLTDAWRRRAPATLVRAYDAQH